MPVSRTANQRPTKKLSDEDILKNSQHKERDSFDRHSIERKLQRAEKKLHSVSKDDPEFDILMKRMDRYKASLEKHSHSIENNADIQDYLEAMDDKSKQEQHSPKRTWTSDAIVGLSSPRSSAKSSGDTTLKSNVSKGSSKKNATRNSTKTDPPTDSAPMSPAQESLISESCCSPTELGESYISIDPFSPAFNGNSKKQAIPAPPLAQASAPQSQQQQQQQLFCKVFQQNSDDMSTTTQVGFIMLEHQTSTFQDARQVILEELSSDGIPADMQWKFVVPTLGRVSQKQEAIFGPLLNGNGGDATLGSLQNPLSLVIVETSTSGSTTASTKTKQRMESEATIVTRNVKSIPEESKQDPLQEQCSGQQSNQEMENAEEEQVAPAKIPETVQDKQDGDSDASTSSSEAPAMTRSWKIHKKPVAAPSTPVPATNPTLEDDETLTESSRRRRALLIGYNRPEEFDPKPRSKHDRSISGRNMPRSPRKPRGAKVSQAVDVFQGTVSTNKERNESVISTAESIDSTKPFVVVDPKCGDEINDNENVVVETAAAAEGSDVPKAENEHEEDVAEDSIREVPQPEQEDTAPSQEAATSRFQGFTRRFWKPTEDVEATPEPEENEDIQNDNDDYDGDESDETADLLKDNESADDSDNATAESGSEAAFDMDIVEKHEAEPKDAEPSFEVAEIATPDQDVEEREEPAVVEDEEEVQDESVEESPLVEEDDEIMEIIPVEPRITKRLVMLVTLYSGNREIMPKQKRAISMLETCQIVPRIVDGSDPSNKETRNELFEIAGMRGVYPLFYLEERNEADPRSKSNVTFLGTFETIEKQRDGDTLQDILNVE